MVNAIFPAAILSFRLLWVGLVLILATSAVAAAEISVSLDRNPVTLSESFQITFSATGEPDGEPDFTPLDRDFEIVGRGQTSSISVSDGAYTKTVNWNLTVMAKRAGTLVIPPVAFGQDTTRPVSVLVKSAPVAGNTVDPGGAELFLEVEAEPKDPYVQSQVLYAVRLFRRVEITQASLSEPEIADAVVAKLGEDVGYTAERNGVHYAVTERNYAIFPQKSGQVTIPALELTAQLIVSGRSTSRFDGFFGRQTTRTKRLASEPIVLDVRPVPDALRGTHWLPAENLTLAESWSHSPGEAVVGEPLTRTLSLTADGVTVGLLPEIAGSAALSASSAADQLNRYSDQPVLNEEKHTAGVRASRQEKTALIAADAGRYIVPAIEIPWWNTKTDRLETARVPERVVEARFPPGRSKPAPAAPPQRVTAPSALPHASSAAPGQERSSDTRFWMWLSLALGAAWVATLAIWWLRARKSRERKRPDPRPPKRQDARAAVRQACRRNDPAAVKDALIRWALLQWPDEPRAASLDAVARRCPDDLAREIRRVDRVLYGREQAAWQGDALGTAFSAWQHRESPVEGEKCVLEPLYKL